MIAVDLYSGAGGMSPGFEQAGFDVRLAVDNSQVNVHTHSINFPDSESLERDLATTSGFDLRKDSQLGDQQIDVVFGGPPCQGFSVGGRRDPSDARNAHVAAFARLVTELAPRYFVVENVLGLLSTGTEQLRNLVAEVGRAGYDVAEPLKLNSSDFGVPQSRTRVFVIGRRGNESNVRDPRRSRIRPTVRDAIADLQSIRPEEVSPEGYYFGRLPKEASNYARSMRSGSGRAGVAGLSGCQVSTHSVATVARFDSLRPGERDSVSRFLRLDPDGMAPTLRAGSGPDRGSYTAPRPIHPSLPRCISVREAARLHSIPDWFALNSTIWHGFRQVGNSVPPALARAVAKSIYDSAKQGSS